MFPVHAQARILIHSVRGVKTIAPRLTLNTRQVFKHIHGEARSTQKANIAAGLIDPRGEGMGSATKQSLVTGRSLGH